MNDKDAPKAPANAAGAQPEDKHAPELYHILTNFPPLPDTSTQNTPLAPSVEKAYYRKCIELKRRLNEVETANDEAKLKRVRLDRAIMKMRLERAFLLDELRKRMDKEMDDSEGSGDDGVNTPPPDRPHRDKRRRTQLIQPTMPTMPLPGPNSHAHHAPAPPILPSQRDAVSALPPGPRAAAYEYQSIRAPDGNGLSRPEIYPRPPTHGSPHGAPVGVPGAADRQMNGGGQPSPSVSREHEAPRDAPISRDAGVTGEALSAGPAIAEGSNGERRIVSASSTENANVESGVQARDGQEGPSGAAA